ncbi:Mur ligase family protein [Nocardia abscessus]|uniref:Mur ligase family protein n=1 Tax=Nocardia abscessus TaxID=120957 RepID=UPI001E53801C|nr:Mur ligase family protein [Nocardia abscessus]
MARHGSVVATERSFNNEIGFPHTVLRVQADTDFLVLEMGARGRGHISWIDNFYNTRAPSLLPRLPQPHRV